MELDVQIKKMLECLACDFADSTLPYIGEDSVEKLPEERGTYTSRAVCSRSINEKFMLVIVSSQKDIGWGEIIGHELAWVWHFYEGSPYSDEQWMDL